MSNLTPESRIFVAGHRGMVGSAILRLLEREGYRRLVTRTSQELDLTDQGAVREFFRNERVDYVVLAAAKVGGIHANNVYPAEFIYRNLMIQCNVIHQAWEAGVTGLLFLGSSCIYPKYAPQPMREEYLLTGILEPTNEPYAVAKIAGIKTCEAYNRQYGTDYRAVMPTNLYGPGDNYHLENSHVIPAMIRKYHLAKLAAAGDYQGIARDERSFGPIPDDIKAALGIDGSGSRPPCVPLWGTGKARREFLHVDDMAGACLHVMHMDPQAYREVLQPLPQKASGVGEPEGTPPCFINVGTGRDCTIREAAELIREVVGYDGETRYDSSRPDGTPKKLEDTTRLTRLGWQPSYGLREGLQDAYAWYCRKQN